MCGLCDKYADWVYCGVVCNAMLISLRKDLSTTMGHMANNAIIGHCGGYSSVVYRTTLIIQSDESVSQSVSRMHGSPTVGLVPLVERPVPFVAGGVGCEGCSRQNPARVVEAALGVRFV